MRSHAKQADRAERLATAKATLIELARDYAGAPSPEIWRELCRAKATIDALR